MSIQFQRQIRNNVTEIKDYLKDLYNWEEKIENKKPKQKKAEFDYPIRQLEINNENENAENIQKFRKNKTTITNYYNAWDNLDVEKEIEKVDKKIPKEMNDKKIEENKFRELLLDPKIKKSQADKLYLKKNYKASEIIYKEILELILKIDKNIFSENNKKKINDFQIKIMGNLSQNLLNNKKFEDSKKICFDILDINKNFLKTYFRLGKIFELEKKYDKSIEFYNKGLINSESNLEKDEFLKKIRFLKKKIKKNLDIFKNSMEINKYEFNGKRYFCDIKENLIKKENLKKVKQNFDGKNQEEIEKEFSKYFKQTKIENLSYDFLKLKNIDGKLVKKAKKDFTNKKTRVKFK